MTRIRGLLLCACAALACAGAHGAAAGLEVGVTEDAGKADGGAAFFATLSDVGLKANRVSINWDPAHQTTISGQAQLAAWLPKAQVSGTRVVFAVAPHDAKDFNSSAGAKTQFVDFVRKLAQTFPTVKDYVIGNEPNQPLFQLPQFAPNGKAVSAAAYLPVLAGSYDALKAVNPTITVIGVGLSPRGNDLPFAKSNISRSPVRFLHDLGVAYRASKRTTPLMDEFAFHPYPARNSDAPDVGYVWPNAGLPNLDRIKQALWDAFHGTAQPTVAEPRKTFARPLKLDLDEVGWQVAIQPALVGLYFGAETPNLVPVSEQTQADYYREVITSVECDPAVRMLSFFHLSDELDLGRWQSGLIRADGSKRPSYDAVRQTIAQTHESHQHRRPPARRVGEAEEAVPAQAQAVELHRGSGRGGVVQGGDLQGRAAQGRDREAPADGAPEAAAQCQGDDQGQVEGRISSGAKAEGRDLRVRHSNDRHHELAALHRLREQAVSRRPTA